MFYVKQMFTLYFLLLYTKRLKFPMPYNMRIIYYYKNKIFSKFKKKKRKKDFHICFFVTKF